jgi:hypothetical protein
MIRVHVYGIHWHIASTVRVNATSMRRVLDCVSEQTSTFKKVRVT